MFVCARIYSAHFKHPSTAYNFMNCPYLFLIFSLLLLLIVKQVLLITLTSLIGRVKLVENIFFLSWFSEATDILKYFYWAKTTLKMREEYFGN